MLVKLMNLLPSHKRIFFSFVGFEKPSAIQQRAIRPIVKGRDVIAQLVLQYSFAIARMRGSIDL